MKCSELQFDLSLYSENGLNEGLDLAVRSHIEICPLCRQRMADHREIASGLRRLTRPEIPVSLQNRIKMSVRAEKNAGRNFLPASDLREWLTMQVMPYSVGVVASIVIGVSFLTMMFSGLRQPQPESSYASNDRGSVLLASNSNPFFDAEDPITATHYANTRLGFGYESPSVNPSGALIALTRSLIRGGMKDDEVVVVADVFGNGLARIAEVVEPSRDRAAVLELQRALQSDPAFAPFVPTNIEQRPESVRVVLKLQSVNVSTREEPTLRR